MFEVEERRMGRSIVSIYYIHIHIYICIYAATQPPPIAYTYYARTDGCKAETGKAGHGLRGDARE